MRSKSISTFATKTSTVCPGLPSIAMIISINSRENYLFLCQCNRCLTEASEPDQTSEEESEDDMDED